VFRDQEFSSDLGSRGVKRIEDVRILRGSQFPQDAGPMAHPVRPDSYIEINNFYTVTVYNKGAEVIRMIQTLLGQDGFRRGMDLYFQRHDGQAVTCDDFVAAMADANSADLGQFKRWYHQAGTPELTVSDAYDPATADLYADRAPILPADARPAAQGTVSHSAGAGVAGCRGPAICRCNWWEKMRRREPPACWNCAKPEHTFQFMNIPARPGSLAVARLFRPGEIEQRRKRRGLALPAGP
jgi:aminopeptidase N